MKLSLSFNGQTRQIKTPLLFAARSSYQLEQFNLSGSDDILKDNIVVFVGTKNSRAGLFASAWRLVRGKLTQGLDYETIVTDSLTVESQKKNLLMAFDGEKKKLISPFQFKIIPDALEVCVPKKEKQ